MVTFYKEIRSRLGPFNLTYKISYTSIQNTFYLNKTNELESNGRHIDFTFHNEVSCRLSPINLSREFTAVLHLGVVNDETMDGALDLNRVLLVTHGDLLAFLVPFHLEGMTGNSIIYRLKVKKPIRERIFYVNKASFYLLEY